MLPFKILQSVSTVTREHTLLRQQTESSNKKMLQQRFKVYPRSSLME